MTMGEQPKKSKGSDVLVYPENWDEMVKKYEEREKEQLEVALKRRNVGSLDELRQIALDAIEKRAYRTAKEHEPLKNYTILVEPKSQDIKTLRQQLNEEISALARETFKQLPHLKIEREALKGRIKIASPDEERAEMGAVKK